MQSCLRIDDKITLKWWNFKHVSFIPCLSCRNETNYIVVPSFELFPRHQLFLRYIFTAWRGFPCKWTGMLGPVNLTPRSPKTPRSPDGTSFRVLSSISPTANPAVEDLKDRTKNTVGSVNAEGLMQIWIELNYSAEFCRSRGIWLRNKTTSRCRDCIIVGLVSIPKGLNK